MVETRHLEMDTKPRTALGPAGEATSRKREPDSRGMGFTVA